MLIAQYQCKPYLAVVDEHILEKKENIFFARELLKTLNILLNLGRTRQLQLPVEP